MTDEKKVEVRCPHCKQMVKVIPPRINFVELKKCPLRDKWMAVRRDDAETSRVVQ